MPRAAIALEPGVGRISMDDIAKWAMGPQGAQLPSRAAFVFREPIPGDLLSGVFEGKSLASCCALRYTRLGREGEGHLEMVRAWAPPRGYFPGMFPIHDYLEWERIAPRNGAPLVSATLVRAYGRGERASAYLERMRGALPEGILRHPR